MRRLGILCCFVALTAPPMVSAQPAEPASLRVVVHVSRDVDLAVRDLRAIFLKQRRFWSDGEPIVAINRDAGSRARESFSMRIFGEGSRRLAGYWNQRYFEAGEFPPSTLASDEAVLRFVAQNENAIGYVLADDVGVKVRIVRVLE